MKQAMVKQVRDYRAKGSVKRIQFIGRNYAVKLKAVELSSFVHGSVPILQNFSTSGRSEFLDYFFLPKSLLLLMTAVGFN